MVTERTGLFMKVGTIWLKPKRNFCVDGFFQFDEADQHSFGFVNSAGVTIVGYGDNFKLWFPSLFEYGVPRVQLVIRQLNFWARDESIIANLKCRKRVIGLAHFAELLKKQFDGRPGLLSTDGSANLGYVLDVKTVWRVVIVRWLDKKTMKGWYLDACPYDTIIGWNANGRIISR